MVWIGLASLSLLVVLGSQGGDANTVPRDDGLVQVVGYRQVGLTGSEGPVTAEVGGSKAAAILAAYARLAPSKSGPFCVEALNAFSIRVFPPRGARPLLTATEYDCPSPGVVRVDRGSVIQDFRADCIFRHAVVAALPSGRAEGTRDDSFAQCGH